MLHIQNWIKLVVVFRRVFVYCLGEGALWQKDIYRAADGQDFGKELDFVQDHTISMIQG